MENALFSKKDIEEMFSREAVFIGAQDVLPIYRAERLFGKQAVASVMVPQAGGDTFNIYGMDGGSVTYLTRRGAMQAATYRNVKMIQLSEGAIS